MRKITLKQVIIVITFSLFAASLAFAQDDLKPVPEELKVGFDSISGSEAVSYIKFLASDELEGRDTASHGQRIARKYITSFYEIWGIAPAGDQSRRGRSYEQRIRVDVFEDHPKADIEMRTGTKTKRFFYGSDVFLSSMTGLCEIEAPIAFVGYAISAPELGYDDFAGIDLDGKIAMFFYDLPGSDNPDSPFLKPENRSKHIGLSQRIDEVKQRGAVAAIFVVPGEMSTRTLYKYAQGDRIYPPSVRFIVPQLESTDEIPVLAVTGNPADAALSAKKTNWREIKDQIDSTLKPNSMELDNVTVKIKLFGELKADVTGNLLGMIEGADPELKDEVILICAHLDHFGMNEDKYVFNGADDNASGSAAVMELAQAFALNPDKPKRTIVFAHWTGEERGLIGSRYFAEFPTVPLENIVVCINLDMVGREFTMENLSRWKRRFGSPDGMEAINSENISNVVMAASSFETPELLEIIKSVNQDHLGLLLPVRPCVKGGGSDENSFYVKKVPSIVFNTAMHEDYHTAVDTADKISGNKVQQITQLVYLVATELANRQERIVWMEEE